MRLRIVATVVVFLALVVPRVASAQEAPTPAPNGDVGSEPASTAEPVTQPSAGTIEGQDPGITALSTTLAVIRASTAVAESALPQDAPVTIPPITAASRDSETVYEPLCFERGDGFVDGGLSAEEQSAWDAQQYRETYGATGQEILDFINSAGGTDAAPVSRSSYSKGTLKSPTLLVQGSVAQSEPATETVGDAAQLPDCLVPYVCAAERVDDVVSGHIDSEADGAYAEYAVVVAGLIDAGAAGLRAVESQPPSADAVTIPTSSSEQGLVSLMGAMAEYGLGDSPGELFMPVFNYCRQGPDGDIEVDPLEDPRAEPGFTWTPLESEFDVDGASDAVFDQISRELHANLPDMRTIPPMETGVTIVKFPMWLWLNEPFTFTERQGLSPATYVRIQGRATFDHVTWTLGDYEIECTLADMQEYFPGTGMSPADKPACHHIFRELVEYEMTAAVTYRVEQQISIRQSLGVPFPERAWEPHPTNAEVTIESVSPQMAVREIYSVNVPIDATPAEIAALSSD